MAYGTSAGVTLRLGSTDQVTFTSANITAAIAEADTIVDTINPNAAAANKTIASNIIAAQLLLIGRGNYQTAGVASGGGQNRIEPVARGSNPLIPEEVYLILQSTTVYEQNRPSSSGSWS